jgi:hypothetical protein
LPIHFTVALESLLCIEEEKNQLAKLLSRWQRTWKLYKNSFAAGWSGKLNEEDASENLKWAKNVTCKYSCWWQVLAVLKLGFNSDPVL